MQSPDKCQAFIPACIALIIRRYTNVLFTFNYSTLLTSSQFFISPHYSRLSGNIILVTANNSLHVSHNLCIVQASLCFVTMFFCKQTLLMISYKMY